MPGCWTCLCVFSAASTVPEDVWPTAWLCLEMSCPQQSLHHLDLSDYISFCAAPIDVFVHKNMCCTCKGLYKSCAAPGLVIGTIKISFPDGWCKKSHAWAPLRLAVKYAMEQAVEEKWWRLNPLYPPPTPFPAQLLTLLPSCLLCKYVNRGL